MGGYYKVLGHDRECVNGGNGYWNPYEWVVLIAQLSIKLMRQLLSLWLSRRFWDDVWRQFVHEWRSE